MDELTIRTTINLDADTARVWDALVNPDMTKQYLFGCKVVSDWKTGGKIQWVGRSKGKEKIYLDGVIVKIDPPRLLKFAIVSSNSRYVDTPSNYIQTEYRLSTKYGKTELLITQGDYSKVEDSERRFYEAEEGLDYIFAGLKIVVEGRSEKRKKLDEGSMEWMKDDASL
jgi:uncharacterized protein YndB with AHSA1/START domain